MTNHAGPVENLKYSHTSNTICLGPRLGSLVCDVPNVYGYSRFGQVPDEILYLIPLVLVCQELDEFMKPLLGIFDQQPARVAQVWVVRIENVGS